MAIQAEQDRIRHRAELDLEWKRLLDKEQRLFEDCCKLDQESDGTRTEDKAKALREWWRVAAQILWMHSRTKAKENYELKPYPVTFLRLAKFCEFISNGNVPSFVTDAAKQGRPMGPAETRHIAVGIFYIEACKAGLLSDSSPVKTVRKAYGVTPKAVQRWQARRHEICEFTLQPPLARLGEEMERAAEIYKKLGRGAAAKD